jgi:hypothetical protein
MRMRTQAAHGDGGSLSAAAPEALMAVATKGQSLAAAQQAQPGSPVVPFSLVRASAPATSQPRTATAVQGQSPQLLFDLGMFLPAHKPNRGKRDIKPGASSPG